MTPREIFNEEVSFISMNEKDFILRYLDKDCVVAYFSNPRYFFLKKLIIIKSKNGRFCFIKAYKWEMNSPVRLTKTNKDSILNVIRRKYKLNIVNKNEYSKFEMRLLPILL